MTHVQVDFSVLGMFCFGFPDFVSACFLPLAKLPTFMYLFLHPDFNCLRPFFSLSILVLHDSVYSLGVRNHVYIKMMLMSYIGVLGFCM